MKLFLVLSVCLISSLSLANADPKPSDAKALGKELMSNLPGIFSLDDQNTEKMSGLNVPALVNGNWVLKSRPVALVDSFTAQTQAIATIFVKVDDEFVRIMTTEPKEKVGTVLNHDHPAYKRMIGELRYTNKVTLAGKDFMADYDVFRDRQGRVLGAYLVGIPL